MSETVWVEEHGCNVDNMTWMELSELRSWPAFEVPREEWEAYSAAQQSYERASEVLEKRRVAARPTPAPVPEWMRNLFINKGKLVRWGGGGVYWGALDR